MRVLSLIFALFVFAWTGPASADDLDNLVGNWSWEKFVVAVSKGGEHGISVKVVSGPKNVGMEMIKSPLKPKDGNMVGRVQHPLTEGIYNTTMKIIDADTFNLKGCTDEGACAEGTFKRVK